MDTFNTAIWRKDVRAVYILYSKNKHNKTIPQSNLQQSKTAILAV